jgi:hypothetical protein
MIKHLKFLHNIGNISYKSTVCPKDTCSVTISSWSGFLRHVKAHEDNIESSEVDLNDFSSVEQENSSYANSQFSVQNYHNDNNAENISVETGINILTDLLGNFCSALLASGVNNSTIDFVVQELKYCFNETIGLILKMGRPHLNENFEQFSIQITSLLKSFKNIQSSYLRQKFYEKSSTLVLPIEKTLGSRTELRVRDAKRQQVIVEDSFMYIPLIKTLEQIISTPHLGKYFKNYSSNDSNVIEFFQDSSSFKNNKLFKEFSNSIQIQLFYDDFETVNPLGSKRGIHKLGGIYFTLRNFPGPTFAKINPISRLSIIGLIPIKNLILGSFCNFLGFGLDRLKS